jgi:hypothetical protein
LRREIITDCPLTTPKLGKPSIFSNYLFGITSLRL